MGRAPVFLSPWSILKSLQPGKLQFRVPTSLFAQCLGQLLIWHLPLPFFFFFFGDFSSLIRDQICSFCSASLNHWTARESPHQLFFLNPYPFWIQMKISSFPENSKIKSWWRIILKEELYFHKPRHCSALYPKMSIVKASRLR